MHLNSHCLWWTKSHHFRDSTCLRLSNWFSKHFHLWVRNCTHLSHWCPESKRGKRLLSDNRQPHSFLWACRHSRVLEKILLLEDGLAPGISEKHGCDLIAWLGKHPATGHLFLCFQLWVCVFNQVCLVPDSHLIYNQTTSSQQESSNRQEKTIISNIPNTRVVGLCVFFPFPAFPPWQPALDQREQIHLFPEYSPLRTPGTLAPDSRCPSFGPHPSQGTERTPLRQEVFFTQSVFIRTNQWEKEKAVRLAILKSDLIKAKKRGMWETVKKKESGVCFDTGSSARDQRSASLDWEKQPNLKSRT